MTLIIAGVACDGVVLCADRAESNETSFRYVNKIFSVHGEVLAYDGDISIGEKILSEIERFEWPKSSSDQIRMVELVTKNENRRYSTRKESNTSTLFMTFHDSKPFIQFFNYDGSSFGVKTFESIGSGETQVEYFLRTLYRPEYNVEKLAEICSFIIQLISESAVNNSVRVSTEYPVETYVIRSGKPYRYDNPYLYDMNHDRILSLHNKLNDMFAENDIIIKEAIRRYW